MGEKPTLGAADEGLGVWSYPPGIIAFREALWAQQSATRALLSPRGEDVVR
jgi:hypothetical protein